MSSCFEIRNGILTFCSGDFEEIVIPDGVCVISDEVFYGDFDIRKVNFPDSIVIIDDFAFQKCSRLTHIELPKNLKYIGRETFAKCTNLVEITIPESVIAIGEKAFYGCKNLQTVRCLGNPVIKRKAFYKTPFGLNKQHEEMLWTNYLK